MLKDKQKVCKNCRKTSKNMNQSVDLKPKASKLIETWETVVEKSKVKIIGRKEEYKDDHDETSDLQMTTRDDLREGRSRYREEKGKVVGKSSKHFHEKKRKRRRKRTTSEKPTL